MVPALYIFLALSLFVVAALFVSISGVFVCVHGSFVSLVVLWLEVIVCTLSYVLSGELCVHSSSLFCMREN